MPMHHTRQSLMKSIFGGPSQSGRIAERESLARATPQNARRPRYVLSKSGSGLRSDSWLRVHTLILGRWALVEEHLILANDSELWSMKVVANSCCMLCRLHSRRDNLLLDLPLGPQVVPFYGLKNGILYGNPKKGTA